MLQILVRIVRQSPHADFFPKSGPHLVPIGSEKSTLMNQLNSGLYCSWLQWVSTAPTDRADTGMMGTVETSTNMGTNLGSSGGNIEEFAVL